MSAYERGQETSTWRAFFVLPGLGMRRLLELGPAAADPLADLITEVVDAHAPERREIVHGIQPPVVSAPLKVDSHSS